MRMLAAHHHLDVVRCAWQLTVVSGPCSWRIPATWSRRRFCVLDGHQQHHSIARGGLGQVQQAAPSLYHFPLSLPLPFILALRRVDHENAFAFFVVFGIWRRHVTTIRRDPAPSRVVAVCLTEVTPVITALVGPGNVVVRDIAAWRAAEDTAPAKGSTVRASPIRYSRTPRKSEHVAF